MIVRVPEKEGKMQKILLKSIFLVIVTSFFLTLISSNASAIPAFARKYKTSCMLCHAPIPKLSAMGEAFRLNGYKLPQADELYVKEEPVSMGADAYKQVFPEAIWPSSIPGEAPIGIRAVEEIDYHPNGVQTNRTEFNFPAEVSLLGAGSLDDNFSFFVVLGGESADGAIETNALAWLMWSNLFSGIVGEHHLNFKVGNVGRHTIALPNTRSENNFTIEDYLYTTELGLDNEPGIQLSGYGAHWRYGVGVVEGDTENSKKDMYVSFALKFGGLGYDGSGGNLEEAGVSTTPSGFWRDDSVLLGFFAYKSYLGTVPQTFNRVGGDLRMNYKDISVAGGYIIGKNHETTEDKHIAFVEGQYFVYPWMVPYVRYENETVKNVSEEDQARLIAGIAVLPRANIRVNLEGRFYSKNEPVKAAGGQTKDDNQIAMILDWAF
jgi:hypothetical protein